MTACRPCLHVCRPCLHVCALVSASSHKVAHEQVSAAPVIIPLTLAHFCVEPFASTLKSLYVALRRPLSTHASV